jgi:four helix bundle protein
MLEIYDVSLQLCRDVRAIDKQLDAHLRDQIRRAVASVALNIAESDGQAGGNRRQRRLTALGSAREVRACFDVGDALCGVAVDDAVYDRLDHVIGVLVKLTR